LDLLVLSIAGMGYSKGISKRVWQSIQGGGMEESVERDARGFDWVTTRALCSLPHIFKQLKSSVKLDVITRNSLRPMQPTYEFWVNDGGNNFTVILEGNGIKKSIGFSLAEHAIVVKDDTGFQMFEVSVRFNDKGECKLIAADENRELWEIRRMALEELLFRTF
jgi:hypothetical protein